MTLLSTTDNPYRMALAQYDRAVQHLALKQGIEDSLRRPERELTVNFPVKMDDGSVRIFTGYRVHHSTARGPTKGGIVSGGLPKSLMTRVIPSPFLPFHQFALHPASSRFGADLPRLSPFLTP